MRQPERGARRVGQVLLVEHLERGLGAGQLGQHRVGAGAGQSSVEQLDHHINFLDALCNSFFGQVHVTGKPLDGHREVLSWLVRVPGGGDGLNCHLFRGASCQPAEAHDGNEGKSPHALTQRTHSPPQ